MITIRAGNCAIGLCLLVLLAGCSREQQDWRSAESADSIEAYNQFIQKHPESELAAQARTRVVQLGEDRDWQHAGSADTADAYREFITQHPNGKWTQEARIRIDNFSLGTSGAGSTSATVGGGAGAHGGTEAGADAPAVAGTAVASSSVASTVRSTLPGPTRSGAFGIQLGAYSSEAAANSEWRALAGRFGSELQGLSEHVVMAETGSGRIYRLQAVVGEETRARAICDSLRKSSQACVAVLPH